VLSCSAHTGLGVTARGSRRGAVVCWARRSPNLVGVEGLEAVWRCSGASGRTGEGDGPFGVTVGLALSLVTAGRHGPSLSLTKPHAISVGNAVPAIIDRTHGCRTRIAVCHGVTISWGQTRAAMDASVPGTDDGRFWGRDSRLVNRFRLGDGAVAVRRTSPPI
jgi:hypothetical protein